MPKKRLGWTFKWVSSFENDFNRDYHVSFTPEEIAKGGNFYNYKQQDRLGPEQPGVSVFYRDDGSIYHTYSAYSRGIDMLNGAYHYLDIVPKGRDESGAHKMSWVRFHDEYDRRAQ